VTRMMRLFSAVLIPIALAQGMGACAAGAASGTPSPATAAVTDLPPPVLGSGVTLERALSSRRSVREYSDQPLTTADIGQLLWAAQGITSEPGFRTAPSAGALYPLEVYLLTAEGVLHYEPQDHQLRLVSQDDARPALYQAALQQEPVLKAPAVFVLAAVYARTVKKYGEERSPRYVQMEAGHAAQNLLLEATALGLGAVPIGAFHDQEVQKAVGLPADHQPLYLIPVGHPRNPGR
jgi:SagB-type dehydrogenase family enzyme